jgi:hypothetical protein
MPVSLHHGIALQPSNRTKQPVSQICENYNKHENLSREILDFRGFGLTCRDAGGPL